MREEPPVFGVLPPRAPEGCQKALGNRPAGRQRSQCWLASMDWLQGDGASFVGGLMRVRVEHRLRQLVCLFVMHRHEDVPALDGAPGGSEGGGASDGVGPPASLTLRCTPWER